MNTENLSDLILDVLTKDRIANICNFIGGYFGLCSSLSISRKFHRFNRICQMLIFPMVMLLAGMVLFAIGMITFLLLLILYHGPSFTKMSKEVQVFSIIILLVFISSQFVLDYIGNKFNELLD